MATDQATALAARARRSFVAPRDLGHAAEGDELLVKMQRDYYGDQEGNTKELLVLNKSGEWQPALSLFEYVQQTLVELCAGYIEISADKAIEASADNSSDEGDDCWYDARSVYADPVGLTRDERTDIDWLLSCVTPKVAAGIVERRRGELATIRVLRLALLRIQVPKDIVGHIESFVAAPAKDSVPFRRDELPGFMQSLSERYEYEAWDCPIDGCIVSAGHLGGVEIWKAQFYAKHYDNCHDDTIVLPRRLLQQYEEHPFVFSLPDDDEDEWPAGAIEVLESAPGHRTYLFEDADGGQHARTFECFVLHPYFVELKRQAEERRRAHHRLYEEQRAQRRVRMQLELAGLERGRRPHEVASRAAGSALAVAAGALLVWAGSTASALGLL